MTEEQTGFRTQVDVRGPKHLILDTIDLVRQHELRMAERPSFEDAAGNRYLVDDDSQW